MDQIIQALIGGNQETSRNILKRICSEGDKKRLRQVCRNWRVVIDQIAGMKLKLDNQNFDLLFESNLRKTCLSLVIEGSAGIIPWNACPFSEAHLQIVEVRGEILVDNWKLLLTTCKGIRTLIIQLQAKPKEGNNIISTWNSWSETPGCEIHLKELSRVFIKGVVIHWDFHYSTIVNLLKTIKTPKLKQFVCEFWVDDLCHQQPTFPEFSQFQESVIKLKQNCSELKSFGWVSAFSKYGKNEFWESLHKRGKNARVIHGSYSVWKPIANLFLAGNFLEEIHYDFGTITDLRKAGQIIQDTVALRSQNIEKLSLGLKTFMTFEGYSFQSLQLFSHLRELTIGWIFGLDKKVSLNDSPRFYWKVPATLEKISISSVTMPYYIWDDILNCPKMKEISIRNQNENFSETLSASIIRKVLNHKTLKWIVVDSSFRSKIEHLKHYLYFIEDLVGKFIYGYEKKRGYNQSFYCLNTSVTRENILENRSVESSWILNPNIPIPDGFAIIIARNVTGRELQEMKQRYTLVSSLRYLLGVRSLKDGLILGIMLTLLLAFMLRAL